MKYVTARPRKRSHEVRLPQRKPHIPLQRYEQDAKGEENLKERTMKYVTARPRKRSHEVRLPQRKPHISSQRYKQNKEGEYRPQGVYNEVHAPTCWHGVPRRHGA